MLYISRYVDNDAYGLVDTDNGVEQVAEYGYLQEAVFKNHATIAGVEALPGPFDAIRVSPYQPVETMTQLQVKTNLMRFIDIKTYGDMITSVVWDEEKITRPVSIRLSDFGTILADKFMSNGVGGCEKLVTFVLDNKLKYSFFAFVSPRQYGPKREQLDSVGVTFDMRELNERNARSAYYLLSDSVLFECMHNCVIDKPKRLHRVETEGNAYLCGGRIKPQFV